MAPMSQTSSQDASGASIIAGEGVDGATAPALTIQVGGKDVSGNLQTIFTDTNGSILSSSKIPINPASPTAATVGVTSASAVTFNASRKGLVLINTSIHTISLGFGVAAVLNSGITLYPGGVFVMDEFMFTTDSVSAISSAASSNLSIQEYS